jgi:Na+/melibiose symporter-like transporter
MSHASAITRIVQQLGGAVGTAIVAVMLTLHADSRNPAQAFDWAFWVIVMFTAAAAVIALFLPAAGARSVKGEE